MFYIDGFVIPVPIANKQAFIDHAKMTDTFFLEHGALRVVECWAEDLPDGVFTDFRKAVYTQDDDTSAFSWVEWPDKATCDAAMGRVDELVEGDPRRNPEANPVPFDGKRMIYGGFATVLDI